MRTFATALEPASRFGLLQQALAAIEVVAQTLDAGELSEHLRTSGVV